MNEIKYGLRDKGTVPVSLRFPFHFHAGWDWEQTLHHGKQEEEIQQHCMYLNQLQVAMYFLPVTVLYFPKVSQSSLILKEKDQTAE